MRRRRFERDPTILLYPMYIYAYTGTLCVLAEFLTYEPSNESVIVLNRVDDNFLYKNKEDCKQQTGTYTSIRIQNCTSVRIGMNYG